MLYFTVDPEVQGPHHIMNFIQQYNAQRPQDLETALNHPIKIERNCMPQPPQGSALMPPMLAEDQGIPMNIDEACLVRSTPLSSCAMVIAFEENILNRDYVYVYHAGGGEIKEGDWFLSEVPDLQTKIIVYAVRQYKEPDGNPSTYDEHIKTLLTKCNPNNLCIVDCGEKTNEIWVDNTGGIRF